MEQEKNNFDIDKILKYNGEFIFKCNMVLVLGITVSLILLPVTDSLSIVLSGVFAFYLLIFATIDIANRIESKWALRKYDIEVVKKELSNISTKKFDGIEIYLTDNYIVSNAKVIRITKYQDIAWVYASEPLGRVSQNVAISIAYRLGGTPVVAYSKEGKKLVIALVKNEEQLKEIYSAISRKNKKVLRGNTIQNRKVYQNIKKGQKKK